MQTVKACINRTTTFAWSPATYACDSPPHRNRFRSSYSRRTLKQRKRPQAVTAFLHRFYLRLGQCKAARQHPHQRSLRPSRLRLCKSFPPQTVHLRDTTSSPRSHLAFQSSSATTAATPGPSSSDNIACLSFLLKHPTTASPPPLNNGNAFVLPKEREQSVTLPWEESEALDGHPVWPSWRVVADHSYLLVIKHV